MIRRHVGAQSEFSNEVTVQAYTAAPAVSSPIGSTATSASGTSTEADGTAIQVYKNGSPRFFYCPDDRAEKGWVDGASTREYRYHSKCRDSDRELANS